MEHFKRSTSRDFRINCATLDAALREDSSEDEEEPVQPTLLCIFEKELLHVS